jgi:hypothetical protein
VGNDGEEQEAGVGAGQGRAGQDRAGQKEHGTGTGTGTDRQTKQDRAASRQKDGGILHYYCTRVGW